MTDKNRRILVVGAGFAGATVARQLGSRGGYTIDVIDQRQHIAGNAFDLVHAKTGGRYHKFGPHIFHTNDKRIFDYLSQFTEWLPYKHRVQALVEGVGDVPMPINIDTVNKLFNRSISDEIEFSNFLQEISVNIDVTHSAYDHLVKNYGLELTELFFSRYTKKMWGLELQDVPVSTVARIPVRSDNNPYYFNDAFQFMPKWGYTRLFENLLDHDAITVNLGVGFDKKMEGDYDHVFNSMPIDEYYNFQFGDLPYRSIKFEHRVGESFNHSVPTINFTDNSKYTRKTGWHLYPGCERGRDSLVTYEIPCDYKDNSMERYYPVKTVDNAPQSLYKLYRGLADNNSNVTHIGRCGQYIYYDMHQVVANSMLVANRFCDG